MNAAPQHHSHRAENFVLASGTLLPEVVTSYVTLGRLDASARNAVLVLHGYTTAPSMLFPGSSAAEGSWSELVGPGRAIDTDRYFVVCPNALGSCCGSTGPASIDPRSGRPYGLDFPEITVGDMVVAQKGLLDALGVRHLAAVAGPSMGSFQAFEWGVAYPDFVGRVVAAVGAPYNTFGGARAAVLAQLQQDPAWDEGRALQRPGSMCERLTQMRVDTLTRYGIDAELAERLPQPAARATEIHRLALEWARDFDPGSLLTLMGACERFDVRERLAAMRAPLLYALSRTDTGFPPSLFEQLGPLFDRAGVRWQRCLIDSERGHFASGADARLWAEVLRDFMRGRAAN